MNSLPHADDVRTVPELIDTLRVLRENAVTNCNYPAAVLWRDMQCVIEEYNNFDAFDAKECTKALAKNLTLLARIMDRIANGS